MPAKLATGLQYYCMQCEFPVIRTGATVARGMEKAGKERHAGIPEAVFVVRVWTKLHLAKPSHPSPYPQEDVDAYMRDVANSSAEVVLKRFDEQRNKYKFLEANLKQKKQRWVLCCGLASLLCCDCLSAACTQAEESDPRHPEDIRHGALYQEQAGKAGLFHQWLHTVC